MDKVDLRLSGFAPQPPSCFVVVKHPSSVVSSRDTAKLAISKFFERFSSSVLAARMTIETYSSLAWRLTRRCSRRADSPNTVSSFPSALRRQFVLNIDAGRLFRLGTTAP